MPQAKTTTEQDSDSKGSPYQGPTKSHDRAPGGTVRLASIDSYRGIVMFLMLAEVLELSNLSKSFPESVVAGWLSFHTSHVAWLGCSLHDMIQPSFSFLVGVSLPFSLASRASKGASLGSMVAHALWRSLVLILLGVVLRMWGRGDVSYFYFVDTLTQIGLGYFALFWLARWGVATQLVALLAILVGYWGWFAAWPLPPPGWDTTAVGVASDWPHLLSGFAAHWNMNMNPAHAFEVWWMNLFPQGNVFVSAGGGYVTLNFVPTLGTMILGVLAGGVLQQDGSTIRKLSWLVIGGLGMTGLGWALGELGICPVVKRIWTPAWVLYSGGLCFASLGLLHAICDVAGWRLWAWPLLVIGANSILAYMMSWVLEGPLKRLLRIVGERLFMIAGEPWEPVLLGSAVLFIMWLILFALFRWRIFLRV